ncbi:MAG: hypothetical protein ABII07_01450 [Patescibacteria group bacterium]|nr:hypothetical protein [Patescibacteria group bacterium]
MKNILIPTTSNNSLTEELKVFYNTFKGLEFNTKVNFNLSALKWATPLVMLPIVAYIHSTGSSFTLSEDNDDVNSYLKTVYFPKGADSTDILKAKNYIPISFLENTSDPLSRELVIDLFSELIYKSVGGVKGTKTALFYPISELATNIFEHSKRKYGFAFGQIFPKKQYLEVCIADCGRGLAGSYNQESGLDLTDAKAIKEVMEGHSTKNDKERGFGIRTSKKAICEKLKGEFMLLSGNSVLISGYNTEDKIVTLPKFHWQGVVIVYRIPSPKHPIDITDYYE